MATSPVERPCWTWLVSKKSGTPMPDGHSVHHHDQRKEPVPDQHKPLLPCRHDCRAVKQMGQDVALFLALFRAHIYTHCYIMQRLPFHFRSFFESVELSQQRIGLGEHFVALVLQLSLFVVGAVVQ